MDIVVMTAPGTVELRDIEKPSYGPGEVLVKVSAVGICTWEQRYFRGVPDSYPFFGGHEISGVVEAVGSEVAQKLSPGDKVVVASLTRCGECYYCRKGLDNLCENTGSESNPGGLWGPRGFSEYFVARGYEVYRLGDQADPVTATLAEPVACVLRSMDRGRVGPGETALVLGGGVMGLLRGAEVIVSEPDPGRRAKALALGASAVVDPLNEDLKAVVAGRTEGRGVEAVFFTAGGRAAIEGGISCLVKNGTLVIYGGTGAKDQLTLDPKIFHYDEIYITGVTKHTKDTFRRAAEIISRGRLPLAELISETYPFSQVQQAFERAGAMDTYRVVLTP